MSYRARGVVGLVSLATLGLALLVPRLASHESRPIPYHAPAQTTCVRQRSEPPNYGRHHAAHPKPHWVRICSHPKPRPTPQGYPGWNQPVPGA